MTRPYIMRRIDNWVWRTRRRDGWLLQLWAWLYGTRTYICINDQSTGRTYHVWTDRNGGYTLRTE